jgi:hypothetical protein
MILWIVVKIRKQLLNLKNNIIDYIYIYMGTLTKIEEQAHIVVPVFFLLILYINNMPVDFNIKVLSPQEILPLAPKATFKNMLLIVSFTIFMLLFETGIGNWKWKYLLFASVLVISWIFYAIFYFTGLEKIKNGEVLNGYINDIKIDDKWTAGINSGIATVAIGIIFLAFLRLNKWVNDNKVPDPYTSLKISIPVILCLSVLYLKADGVLGLFYGCYDKGKDMIEDLKKEPWYFWLYWIFIGILLFWTLFGPGSVGSKKIYNYIEKKAMISAITNGGGANDVGSSNWTKYINPYGTLGRDTNHPALAVFVLLIMAYMFRDKKKGFVIFTVLIIIWEILYDTSDIVKNNMKKTLLAFFILFLLIDASFSSKMINDEGENIKKDRESE